MSEVSSRFLTLVATILSIMFIDKFLLSLTSRSRASAVHAVQSFFKALCTTALVKKYASLPLAELALTSFSKRQRASGLRTFAGVSSTKVAPVFVAPPELISGTKDCEEPPS